MKFLAYTQIAGENTYAEVVGLYQCESCKSLKLNNVNYNEYLNDVCTVDYMKQLENQYKKDERNYTIFKVLFGICLIFLTLVLMWKSSTI